MGAKLAGTDTNVIYVTPKNFGSRQNCGLFEEHRQGVSTDGFKPIEVLNRSTNETTQKLVRRYQYVDGYITDVKWYDTEKKFAQRYMGFKLTLEDELGKIVIDLPYKSRALDRFGLFCPNIDLAQPVTFFAFPDSEDDHIVFIAKQNDVTIRNFWTKENPGKLPPATYDDVDGWDFSQQRKFVATFIRDEFASRVQKATESRVKPAVAVNPVMDAQSPLDKDLTDDDIPF